VVLPAPFGPMTARNSPALTAKLTPLAAATTAEVDVEIVDPRDRGHCGTRRRTSPARPPGLKRITTISMAPKISSR